MNYNLGKSLNIFRTWRLSKWLIAATLTFCLVVVSSCSNSKANQPESIRLDYAYYNPVSLVLPSNLLPAPSSIIVTIGDLAFNGELFYHIGMTLYRVLLGFFIGSILATIFGALTGYSSLAHQLLDPLLQALRNIPSLAWVPLFILWMGIHETAKIMLIAVGVFFPVYLNLMSGIQGVDRKLIEVGRVYRFSGWQLIHRVFLPATLPAYIVGLRSGLGLGWMFVVAAEIMGASQGLGFLLVDGETTGRPNVIIASILLFAILGKLTDTVLATVGRRLLHWQDDYVSQL